MAISLKHAFNSGKSDGVDATLVQPSNWNAEHTLQLATGKLVGRTTASTGAAEEIAVSGDLLLSSGTLGINTSVATLTDTQTLTNKTLTSPTIATPTITTSATVPAVIGGTAVSSALTLQSTSGVGTSDSIALKVGNNGATTAMTINTSGEIGIGTTSQSGNTIRVSKNLTSSTTNAFGIQLDGQIQSSITGAAFYFASNASAASGTLGELHHFRAFQSGLGTATFTKQYGFNARSSLIGATNNYGHFADDTAAVTAGKTAYGFYSGINTATGGGTTYGFYAAGTAPNYFGGTVTSATSTTTPLLIGGTTASSSLTLQSTSGVGTSDSIAFKVGNNGATTAMTANTSGNIEFRAGTAALPAITTTGDTNTGIFFPAADTIAFAEGGAEAMRLDSAGNMGLGVTPSAWSGYGVAVIEAPAGGTFVSAGNGNIIGSNWYYTASNFIYKTTNLASYYYQVNGQHRWYNAPSGTAGNAITFTQAMTLDASGRLGIGTTSPSTVLSLASSNQPNHLYTGATGTFSWGQFNSSGDASINNGANANLLFATNNAERARIDSSGRLLVGTTSALINESSFGATSNANTATFKTTDGPSQAILVWNSGTGATRNLITFFAGSTYTSLGGITTNGTVVTYGGTSDYRLKEISGAVTGYKERLMALQPKQGVWKTDGSDFRGFLAHEFAQSYPASVIGEKDAVDADGKPKHQSMQASTAEVMADLVALVQEQQALITTLTARITALEAT